MTRRILAAIGLGAGCMLFAAQTPKQDAAKQDEPKQKVVVVGKTEKIDFPSGGTLRFRNSVGVLTVVAWDQPGVEMTTIKSTRVELAPRDREKGTRLLDKVKVAAERHGNEVVIATTFPGHRPFRTFYPLSGNISFDLEYHIKAPANTRIIADHTLGEVNIDGLVSDIQVNLAQGEILLHLPQDEKYAIHAQSDFGSVNSDFSELEKRTGWLLGHRSVDENSAAMHKLNLKVGFGDIVILKIRVPKFPDLTTPAAKADGE
jgi:hypothetical protein